MPHPTTSLSAGWLALRDRLMASPRFHRWALRFPPTRGVARRSARALFDLCAGFVYSQILYACVDLGLFDILAEGAQDADGLARRLRLPTEAAVRLLEAACALDLVERRANRTYGLGSLGAAMRGNAGIAPMIAHHRMLYADLADPVALLRGTAAPTRLASYWPYARSGSPSPLGGDEVAPYTALMSASQAMVAAEILEAYPLGRHRCLLDVGGGDGTFLSIVAEQAPRLRLVLFDLPAVAAQASARFGRGGLAARSEAHGGDFRLDPLPRGADVASLIRVIHDHDDEAALTILRAVRRALPDDGTLILAEPMAEASGARPVGHAYFGFYLLAMGSGRPRNLEALRTLLAQAGFGRVRQVRTRTPMITGLLVARPTAIGGQA